MEKEEILNFLDAYYTLCSLKTKKRQGWIDWNVTGRRESVAEHVFSSQQVAWLLWSQSGIDVDILKVIAMLSLHETEESNMPDFTPFSKVTLEERRKMGKQSVNKVLGKLKKNEQMQDLIDEFNERKTKEAQFAYICDKGDCDLEAKDYSNKKRCSIENASKAMKENEEIQKIIASGATTVEEIFIEFDKEKYVGTVFEDVINFLKHYQIK